MPKCGDFSHQLLDVDEASFAGMRVIRCTIVALDPRHNTVDVEVGGHPYPTVPAGELADTDCPDIPSFEGDGWSADEERRRFNAVPIYYHCQNSTGTETELRMGHMAFRLPLPELTNPPYTPAEVQERHEENLRERVYLVYIPPTATEAAGGGLGHRYVIGHSDIHDIAPCKSEWICIRLSGQFDDNSTANPNYGFTVDPSSTIVTIVDPIAGKKYRGLEPYGVTFPCSAQSIIDKVQAIVLDENTDPLDIEFLDTLHEIAPLYDNAFVFQYPNNDDGGSTYLPPANCHAYQPVRLCWLSHYFDQHLQTVTKADPREYSEPWWFVKFEDPEPYYSVDHTVQIIYSARSYGRWPNLDYYTIIDFDVYPTSIVQPHYQDTQVLHVRTYQEEFPYALIYSHDIDTREIFLQIEGLQGWPSPIADYDGFHCVYTQWDYLRTDESEWDADSPEDQFSRTDWVNHINQYVPWSEGPWYSFEMVSTVQLDGSGAGTYSGQPGWAVYGGFNYPLFYQSASIIRGRLGLYGLATIFHYTNDGYTAEIVGGSVINSFTQDVTEFVAKANFAYLPELLYGEAGGDDSYHVSLLNHVSSASEFLDGVMKEMQSLYMAATHEAGGAHWLGGEVSAFVIDVLE